MDSSDVFIATDAWKSAFPGAVAGALVMSGVRNPETSDALEQRKRDLEERLREQAGRPDSTRGVLSAYVDYYRIHGKTYHVRAQWESVALKGKPIPRRAALVEAMFMAELENLALTAGHDVATLEPPVQVDATNDGDRYGLMNGSELRAGDMMMSDGEGIVSSVLSGPDRRSRITPETTEVLFAVYAPVGVGETAVRDHLDDIRANVLLVSPEAATDLIATLLAC
jgi:DNA/RNA-binding domain of Phe-tRNA-synthetase-like protein